MELLKFEEAEPASVPTLTVHTDGASSTVEPDHTIWRRIETYISHRWTARQCVWTVKGPGIWVSHLSPISNLTADVWDEVTYTWSAYTPIQSPTGGFEFSGYKTYKITATVGDTVAGVPQLVVDAYSRLKAYLEDSNALSVPVGSNSYSQKIGENGIDESLDRSPNYLARAMQYSGAGDLLRRYRRV